MGFLDLFRPKWKHSDPSVRLEAVKGFTSDDATELAQVVRLDRDPRVRRVALKKIDDPELLGELAVRDPDEGLRRDAAEKAGELLLEAALGEDDEARSLTAVGQLSGQRALAEVACKAAFDTVQKQALGRITDDKYRADVAKRSSDGKLRTQAVEQIRDADVLRDLAAGEAKEVGLLALARLKDAAALEYVVRRAKAKAVRAVAKERLEALSPPAAATPGVATGAKAGGKGATAASPATSPQAAARELLCQRLEAAAKTQDFDDGAELVNSAREKWQALGPLPAADPLQRRFDRAASRYHERHDAYLKKQHKNKGGAPTPVKTAPRSQPVVAAALPQPAAPPTAEELARQAAQAAARAAEQVRQQAEAAQREQEQQRRDAAKALRDAERNQQKVEHAAQLQADEERRAAEQKARTEQQQKNHQRLEAECVKLETLVGQDDLTLKKADQALKAAHEVIVASNPLPREHATKLRERYDNARAKLVIRIHELREGEDWNRFANVPKLQALCDKADVLLQACGQEGVDPKDVAAYLKELQADWKTVGPAPKEKSEQLWQRFKLTTDQVYEKTRAASDEERTQNLKKKEELVARAESLHAAGEITDWKAASETVKALQAEWKATGPATSAAREQVEALWQRFKTASDAFFDQRKVHYAGLDEDRAENQRKKEELIAKVERLRSSTDWKATSELLKGLQADWKAIGPAPKEHNEALWQRFRGACDVFFEKRKAAFDKFDEERVVNQKKKEALCEKAEELAKRDEAEPEDAEDECKQLQQEWRHLGPAPKEHNEALWQRFRAACDQIFARGRGPVEMPPESPDAAKFANKLPLSGLLEKIQAATSDKPAEAAPAAPSKVDASVSIRSDAAVAPNKADAVAVLSKVDTAAVSSKVETVAPSKADSAEPNKANSAPAPGRVDAFATPNKVETAAPSKVDAVMPNKANAAPASSKVDTVATPNRVETAAPSKVDAVAPSKANAAPVPGRVDAVATPSKVETAAPSKVDAIAPNKASTAPVSGKVDAVATPNKVEAATPSKADVVAPNKANAWTAPNKVDAVATPNKVETAAPNKTNAWTIQSKVDAATAPNKAEPVVPSRADVVAPTKANAAAPSKVDTVAPNKVDAVTPNKVDAVAPSKTDAVAVPLKAGAAAAATEAVASASAMQANAAVSGSWEKAANSGWEDIDQIISSGQTPQPDEDGNKK